MTKCLHITRARVCCDPSLPDDSGVTWCSDRATCGFKGDARPLHLENLQRLAANGYRSAWLDYMRGVHGSEGKSSADLLRAEFIASRETKAPPAD